MYINIEYEDGFRRNIFDQSEEAPEIPEGDDDSEFRDWLCKFDSDEHGVVLYWEEVELV